MYKQSKKGRSPNGCIRRFPLREGIREGSKGNRRFPLREGISKAKKGNRRFPLYLRNIYLGVNE